LSIRGKIQSVNQTQERYYLQSTFYVPLTLALVLLGTLYVSMFIYTPEDSRFTLAELGFVLCFLGYSVHRASLSWIAFSGDGKEVLGMPSLLDRRLGRQGASSAARITSGAELLFCRRFAYGAFDGYYILLRTPGAGDQILWKELGFLSVRRPFWQKIANEIAQRNGVNARLIQQRVTTEGTQETEWTAQSNRPFWRNVPLAIGLGLFPWMGILARTLTHDPRAIVLIGVLLWVVAFFLFRHAYNAGPASKGTLGFAASILVWTLIFVTLYVSTVFATSAVLAR
jgi:hypothetical protein